MVVSFNHQKSLNNVGTKASLFAQHHFVFAISLWLAALSGVFSFLYPDYYFECRENSIDYLFLHRNTAHTISCREFQLKSAYMKDCDNNWLQTTGATCRLRTFYVGFRIVNGCAAMTRVCETAVVSICVYGLQV